MAAAEDGAKVGAEIGAEDGSAPGAAAAATSLGFNVYILVSYFISNLCFVC